jgi:hypothetical protein
MSIAYVDIRGQVRLQYQIERSWLGMGPSALTTHLHIGTDVHRLKVDEQRGFIITTHQEGGLCVSDITEQVILWALPTASTHLL